MIADPAAFVRANTRLLPVPHAPEIRLHLADEATALWEKTEEQLGAMGLPPPYWAFAWAGGQALARHILDRPEIVRARRVLDFASGSGLVAIAAAQAGAARVAATEIDGFALAAIELNAAANGVSLECLAGDVLQRPVDPAEWDVVLAGDVCYERPMAERVTLWLEAAAAAGIEVLLGDPGRSYLPKQRLERLVEYSVPTTRALEDAEIKRTSVWALRPH